MKHTDFSKAEVLAAIPGCLPSDERDEFFPADMIGARIVFIGTLEDRDLVEGGGMVIDYQPENVNEVVRLVLGFTELGMWEEYLSSASNHPTQA
jgi:hypothetical protein